MIFILETEKQSKVVKYEISDNQLMNKHQFQIEYTGVREDEIQPII